MHVSPSAAVANEVQAGEIPGCVFEGLSAPPVLEAFVPEVVPFDTGRGGCARTYQPPGGDTQIDWPAVNGSHEVICGFQALSCAEVKLLLVDARIELQVVLLSETDNRVQSIGVVLLTPDVLELEAGNERTASGNPQALS